MSDDPNTDAIISGVLKSRSTVKNSTTTVKCQVTAVPSFRYTLQWNFGKSQCSFDTIDDVKKFIRGSLKSDQLPECPECGRQGVTPVG